MHEVFSGEVALEVWQVAVKSEMESWPVLKKIVPEHEWGPELELELELGFWPFYDQTEGTFSEHQANQKANLSIF